MNKILLVIGYTAVILVAALVILFFVELFSINRVFTYEEGTIVNYTPRQGRFSSQRTHVRFDDNYVRGYYGWYGEVGETVRIHRPLEGGVQSSLFGIIGQYREADIRRSTNLVSYSTSR